MKLSHIPVRVATGAFILKLRSVSAGLERQAAELVHAIDNGCLTRSNPPMIHHRTLL